MHLRSRRIFNLHSHTGLISSVLPTIQTPVFIAGNAQSPSTTVSTPSGALIIVGLWTAGSGQTPTDGFNTYQLALQTTSATSGLNCAIYYATNVHGLPAGTTISTGSDTNNFVNDIHYVIGANGGLDRTVASTSPIATLTYTISTSSLNSSSEIAWIMENYNNGLTTWSSAGWTSNTGVGYIGTHYQIVSSTSPVVASPVFSPTNVITPVMATFKAG